MHSHELTMRPVRSYLLRAFYQWIVESDATPCIVIDTRKEALKLPPECRGKDEVVFNISESAARDLVIENDFVAFFARFSGVERRIYLPMAAIQSIYAEENGRGVQFEPEQFDKESMSSSPAEQAEAKPRTTTASKLGLRVVK